MNTEAAFFYVDGIPTKGAWIDLDDITDTDDVLAILAEQGLVPKDEDGEPEYGGDLLVADVDGYLAKGFLSKHDTFDLDGYKECADWCESNGHDLEAAAAYISHFGSWSQSSFEDGDQGKHDSEEAFAEQLVEDLGLLHSMPDNLRHYFDYEKFARDLFITDYVMEDGYVFRRDC